MKIRPKFLAATGVCASAACFLLPAHAMGPKPPASTGPSYTLPNPTRQVIIQPFQNVQAFETPNGVVTTMQDAKSQLGAILTNVVTQAGFSVVQPGANLSNLDPCGSHLELFPAVTDFTMDALSANIQFGFNSLGTINVGQPTATVSDTISLGDVSFALTLYQCDNDPNGGCQSIPGDSVTADQTVLGNEFKFTISYQAINVSGDPISKTDLGKAVQTILTSGVTKLVSSPSMAQVPWSTVVAAVSSDGSITMLAGANSNIKTNQYFTVYSRANSSNACGVFDALDCVATGEVDGPSSIATVYRQLSGGASQKIQVGDVVYVGTPSCALN